MQCFITYLKSKLTIIWTVEILVRTQHTSTAGLILRHLTVCGVTLHRLIYNEFLGGPPSITADVRFPVVSQFSLWSGDQRKSLTDVPRPTCNYFKHCYQYRVSSLLLTHTATKYSQFGRRLSLQTVYYVHSLLNYQGLGSGD